MGLAMVLFRSEDNRVLVAVYLGSGGVDLVSKVGDASLTTSTVKDGIVTPSVPLELMQCFPKATLPELIEQHLNGMQVMIRELHRQPVALPAAADSVRESIQRTVRHVVSRPGQRWFSPRFCVTRFRWQGVTLEQQEARGWFWAEVREATTS